MQMGLQQKQGREEGEVTKQWGGIRQSSGCRKQSRCMAAGAAGGCTCSVRLVGAGRLAASAGHVHISALCKQQESIFKG